MCAWPTGSRDWFTISELSDKHIELAEQVVSSGQQVFVKIIDIDLERRRISLSLKQANEGVDPEGSEFDPALYGMPTEYDDQGNYTYPEGFNPETGEWLDGHDEQRAEWEREYAAAQSRWEAHKAQVAHMAAMVIEPRRRIRQKTMMRRCRFLSPKSLKGLSRMMRPWRSFARNWAAPESNLPQKAEGAVTVVALTGGIAAGKSLVCDVLSQHGVRVVDADQVARDVVQPSMPALQAIAKRFGPDVVQPGGSLDRQALGQLIFADQAAREDLNAIVHPAVWQESHRLFSEHGAEYPAVALVYAVPLLVEGNRV